MKVGDPVMYEACYVRACLVETERGDSLIDRVLSLSGLRDEVLAYLVKAGKKGRL